MRLIDADVFTHNVVKYSHQSTKTIGQALADTPTVDAIPKSVIEDIKAEITESQNVVSETLKFDKEDCFYNGKWVGFELALAIIDKHIGRENE